MTTDKDIEALIERMEGWNRCYPGNINIEVTIDEAATALRAQQDRIQGLERDLDALKEAYKSRASLRAEAAEAKLAEAMDALGSPDEWTEKRRELEGWTGSAWIAGEGDEDLRSECYSFLCGLLGYLQAAEDASRALMQKMEGGTDAGN